MQMEWRALACHSERQRRICTQRVEFFADAQNDSEWPLRLSSLDVLIGQYVGINE